MASRPLVARLRVAPLVAVVVAAWLVLLAGPVGATSGSTRLLDPGVSPRSGTPDTVVSFTVLYRNREGSPADWVRVTVAGATHEMQPLGPVDQVKRGVRYSFETRLPVGTHAVEFSSLGRDKFEDVRSGGTVAIAVAGSGDTGGGSNPGGCSCGSGGSGSAPPGGSGGSGGSSEGSPSSGDSGSGGGSAPSGGSGSAPLGGGSAPSGGSSSGPSQSAGQAPDGSKPPVAVAPAGAAEPDPAVTGDSAAPTGPSAASGAPGVVRSDPAAPAGPGMAARSGARTAGAGSEEAFRIPGVELPGDRIGRLLPVTILTSSATTLVMAFLIFGKRRRDEEPPAPEAELARAAARPFAFAPASALAMPQAAPAGALPSFPAFDPGTGGTDVDLPRWRRPSLLAARKYDPLRDGAIATRLTFAERSASGGSCERRQVRYRIVRLLDRPDEMLGVQLGTLDEGDEVEIVGQHGTYRRVLTPDGREGWVHKMTLGDLVGDDGAGTDSEPEVDADVLLAYLAARARG